METKIIDADDEIYLASENEETMSLMTSSTDDSTTVSQSESGQHAEALTHKTFSIEEGVSGEFDVISGKATVIIEDIADPTLGVAIAHVYKSNDNVIEYGKNFQLNLDEKLIKTNTTDTGAQYSYTDAKGNEHTFKEHFYRIGADGKKTYITENISSIITDENGRLWLGNLEVFRELTTDEGLVATSRLDGTVNNAEWLEQRADEEKQVEEQVKSYKKALCNFGSVNKDNGAFIIISENTLSTPDAVEEYLSSFEDGSKLLLTREEELSYSSLLTQIKSLNTSREVLKLQKESIKDSAKSLALQYNIGNTFDYQNDSIALQLASLDLERKSIEYAKKDYINQVTPYGGPYTEEQQDRIDYYDDQLNLIGSSGVQEGTKWNLLIQNNAIINEQNQNWTEQQEHIKNQIGNFTEVGAPTTAKDGTLKKQYDNIDAQITSIGVQIFEVNDQINSLKFKSDTNIGQFKTYYKEYWNLKDELDTLKTQIPVSYLISDSVVKGFNEAGELVIIQNKYGKYVVIEREKYLATEKTRVSAVYDNDGNTMRFSYNGDKKLSEICNSIGERVTFNYNSDNCLIGINRDNCADLTLSYTTMGDVRYILKIASSNSTSAVLSYDSSGLFTGITRKTDVSSISHDNVLMGNDKEISVLDIEYTENETILIYDNIKQEIYKVDLNAERVTEHYDIINGKVTAAEKYMYCDENMICRTEHAHRSCLNRNTYSEFTAKYTIGLVEDITYDSFNKPTVIISTRYDPTKVDYDGPVEQSTVRYTYNDDRKLVEKKTTHAYYDDYTSFDVTVAVEKYYYDNVGAIVRTEAYVVGEELKTGVNIEEHIYDENGAEIKSVSYNSLDPSSKLYTEKQVDEKGRVIAEYTESGEHKTSFDYERDGVTVNTERLPNGSKFSYGRTNDGGVTAITHSTDNGEENSTIQTRTLDVVTEVKSGNNTVRYAYDEKRRVKAVSLNGVDDYVTYAYEGDNTNAEKVTATTKSGVVSTTVKNAHGNITESKLGTWSVNNTYNDNQQLTNIVDSVSGETTFSYDSKGNMTSMSTDGYYEGYGYDEFDNTVKNKFIIADTLSQTYTYTYKDTANKALESISVGGNTVRPNIDALGRNTGKVIEVGENKIAEEKITYVKFGDHATNMPSNIRFATNGVFNSSMQYRYDCMGNIVEIFENGRTVCRYEYDSLGRLTREDNVDFAKTTTWAYDNNGNIIAKYEYELTAKPTNELHLLDCNYIPYTYDDNSDMLLSYGNETFVYDAIGNPTTYRGKNVMWTVGRRLMIYDGGVYGYDARGRRISKNGASFTYDSNGNIIKQSNGLVFMYDHTGVFAVQYNGATYFYRKDIQGNIIAILDNTGTVVVKYKYDAWGKCKVLDATGAEITDNTHIGILNPFRYRSYYFDHGIGLYFLKTRYYDPEIGRFMTIDDIAYIDPENINGLNLYAYCGDNPVMYSDPNGTSITLGVILGIVTLVGLVTTCIGVGTNNNIVTAIGLTMVAVPALISGVVALVSGATYLSIVGGATALAGVGSGIFALAEYQEAFTGNNWMLDAGMSENWYNGLMITIAALATAGTMATGVLTSIGNAVTPNQMMNSFQNNPNRWKTVKELIEQSRGGNKGGISTYSNYINKWTGSKLGIHKIIRGGKFIHGPHFHPWI